jgi:hypothetical protein
MYRVLHLQCSASIRSSRCMQGHGQCQHYNTSEYKCHLNFLGYVLTSIAGSINRPRIHHALAVCLGEFKLIYLI